jgi:nucleotide-binding universal stress UspA family protein
MKTIRKILFPTKFEELSFRCIERLYALKDAGLEEIVLLHVIDRDEVAHNLFRGFDKKLEKQLREEARLHFEDWSGQIEKAGFRCRQVVEIGRPEGKILEISCREEVDLILAGRHEQMAADAVYLGGTSMGVLRRTAIPVMVCKHGSPEEIAQAMTGDGVYERVLYATDFSDDAVCALEFVKSLSGATKRVDVVHVFTDRDFRRHSDEEMRAEEEECRERLGEICRELKELGMEAEPHLLAGNTAAEVLQAATDHHATVIVMGTKGKHGIKEIWLGSASHRVAELATVPVILVPQERDECYI